MDERATHAGESGITRKAIDVVVVEDDDDARVMLTTVLEMRRFVVRPFASAEGAMESVTRDVPDVVVTDLHLSGSAGWTLAAALRADPRTRHVALIALTGDAAPPPDAVASFDAYLRKPIDVGPFADLVREHAEISREARSPNRGKSAPYRTR